MPDLLPPTRFGNPILREVMPRLTPEEILSETVQALIDNMRYALREK